MTLFKTTTVLGLLVLSLLLLHMKYYAATLRKNIKKTRADIAAAEKHLDLLELEWTALTAPERLEKLAKKHSHLTAGAPGQSLDVLTVPQEKIEKKNKGERP